MACKDDVALTVTWSIEGISYLKHKNVCSSDFYPYSDDDQIYYLRLSMRINDTNFISFYICNNKQDTIERDYELSILAPNGSPLISRKATKCLFNESKHGFSDFAERNEILENRKDEFLENDTLTLRCRLWEKLEEEEKIQIEVTNPHSVEYCKCRFSVLDINGISVESFQDELVFSSEDDIDKRQVPPFLSKRKLVELKIKVYQTTLFL
ncbi:hypothetical protein CEXT_475811 [Caerostris extrusa]|uniref:MATH domain-containing protein n=1 Tax=Caerostris extrusa TaxID=172846 RepID=A0AAV4SKL7_CAEEX|nr:hypothetical protein CEXT_475811 [Caerostris extrusa]